MAAPLAMYLILSATGVSLSLVFLTAGASKLLAGFQKLTQTLSKFGVPSFLVMSMRSQRSEHDEVDAIDRYISEGAKPAPHRWRVRFL